MTVERGPGRGMVPGRGEKPTVAPPVPGSEEEAEFDGEIAPDEALIYAIWWADKATRQAKKWSNEPTVEEAAAVSQAWSFVSLAGSNLQPDPEQIVDETLSHVEGQARLAVERIAEVEAILDEAARSARRHPAIHAALAVIRRKP